jgi:hypothetical protein
LQKIEETAGKKIGAVEESPSFVYGGAKISGHV